MPVSALGYIAVYVHFQSVDFNGNLVTFNPLPNTSITLPISIFEDDSGNTPVTVFFTLYFSDNLFPFESDNAISTPIIGADILDEQQVDDMFMDNITIMFQLLNRVSYI